MQIIEILYNEFINEFISPVAFFDMLINRCINMNYLISIESKLYDSKYLNTLSINNKIIDDEGNIVLIYPSLILGNCNKETIINFIKEKEIYIIYKYKKFE